MRQRESEPSVDAGGYHQLATSALNHLGQDHLGHDNGCEPVYVHDLVYNTHLSLTGGAALAYAGIVVEYVNVSVNLPCLLGQSCHLILLGEVKGQGTGIGGTQLYAACGNLLQEVCLKRSEYELGTFTGKLICGCLTNT